MIGEIRRNKEIRQIDLAEKLGMSQAQLSNLENKDPGKMQLRTAVRLAKALGVKPEDLLQKNEA